MRMCPRFDVKAKNKIKGAMETFTAVKIVLLSKLV
ncbi:hypothetical protein A8975_1092 [Meridianimaribacter flavus]|uniref:Uncharacterized protein n=1 Tax=Meridianimaribacter flavus TaxID=571115 RepID=A0ABY2G5J1_9FLAO|nr:hypothetical protein A8975_1092 [Meridianimaribacter flavus]